MPPPSDRVRLNVHSQGEAGHSYSERGRMVSTDAVQGR